MIAPRFGGLIWLWIGITAILLTGCGGGDDTVTVSVGSGPIVTPHSLDVEASGQIVMVDQFGDPCCSPGNRGVGAVMRVEPTTGNRSVVSIDTAMGSPAIYHPRDVALAANGQLVVPVTNYDDNGDLLGAVLMVDSDSGDRSIVSDDLTGNGPPFILPASIAVESDGQLLVTDPILQVVLRVDPVSGDRSVVTGCLGARFFLSPPRSCLDDLIGSGPLFEVINYFVFIALEADGHLLVSGWDLTVLRVDPVSGDRSIVTGCTDTVRSSDNEPQCIGDIIGNGPLPGAIGPIAVEAAGNLVVGIGQGSGLLRVDPVTGDRSIVSDVDTGNGPRVPRFPTDIAVDADGNLLLTGNSVQENGQQVFRGIMRVDAVTGDRTLVSGDAPGVAPLNVDPPDVPPPDDIGDEDNGFK